MTADQLLQCSPEELRTMTDAQLLEYYAPVLYITRPEQALKPATESKKTGQSSALLQKQAEVMNMMKAMGMDLPL
jgi:hypothetical protein